MNKEIDYYEIIQATYFETSIKVPTNLVILKHY